MDETKEEVPAWKIAEQKRVELCADIMEKLAILREGELERQKTNTDLVALMAETLNIIGVPEERIGTAMA